MAIQTTTNRPRPLGSKSHRNLGYIGFCPFPVGGRAVPKLFGRPKPWEPLFPFEWLPMGVDEADVQTPTGTIKSIWIRPI